jgi:hypothetical protein
VYGDARPDLRELCESRGLSLCVFPWRPEVQRTGLGRDAAYLVRPDGYIGLADPDASVKRIAAYLDARGLRSLQSRSSSNAGRAAF